MINYFKRRMFCFLCKKNKQIEFFRNFIYDFFIIKNIIMSTNFHKLVLLFARIWPDCIQWPYSTILQLENSILKRLDEKALSVSNPILCSIIYITKCHIKKLDCSKTNTKSGEINHTDYYL
jgi:hypothetical protein